MKKILLTILAIILCNPLAGPFYVKADEEAGEPIWQYRLDESGKAIITSLENVPEILAVPEKVEEHEVIGIASNAINCASTVEIRLPEQLQYLEEKAFLDCGSVNTLQMPASLKANNAFEELENLEELYLSKGSGQMNDYGSARETPWYASRLRLANLYLADGVTYIGANSFTGFFNLAKLVLPADLKEVGRNAFYNCLNLNAFRLPSTLETLREGAFGLDDTTGIRNCRLIIPDGIKTIEKGALGPQRSYSYYKNSPGETYFEENYLAGDKVDFSFTYETRKAAIGQLEQLEFKDVPDYIYDEVKYVSSDEKTVRVNMDGTIRALKAGEAVIEARSKSGFASCKILVESEYAPEIEYIRVAANGNVAIEGLESVGSNTLVKGENGYLHGLEIGKGLVSLTINGQEKDYLLEVYKPIDSLQVTPNDVVIAKDGSYALKTAVSGSEETDKGVLYASDNENIIEVNTKGELKAVGFGKCTITAVARDGSNHKQKITVSVPPEKMTVNPKAMPLMVGKKFAFRITNYGKLSYFSSDEEICSVNDNGLITAHKAGECTITIGSQDRNYVATIPVKVINAVAYGIDVSTHQKTLSASDWKQVAKFGIDFVIMREGYGTSKDVRFENNYALARKAGLDIGVYHYLNAGTVEDTIAEAESFLKNIKGKKFEYPVCLDIEAKAQSALGREQFNELIEVFCSRVAQEGYKVAVYSSANLLRRTDANIRSKYDLWMAQWNNEEMTNSFESVAIWQYSSHGKVWGISTRVDMNISFVDYPSIIKNNHFNGY